MSKKEIVEFSQDIKHSLSLSSKEVKLNGKGSSYSIQVNTDCETYEVIEPSTNNISINKQDKEIIIISETNDDFDNIEVTIKACDDKLTETIKVYQKKYTYIKHDVKGFYVALFEELSKELYNNIGTTFDDFNANKWVLLNDEQVLFKNEHPKAKIHEVFTMTLDPIGERTLEQAKNEMLSKIDVYDQSQDVNGFFINNTINAWFTVQERTNYKSSIDAAKLMNVETLTFYVGDVMLNITPEMAEKMLAQIQLYADQCFIVTKQHKAMVETLETIEHVDKYDFKKNYPTKLNFMLN